MNRILIAGLALLAAAPLHAADEATPPKATICFSCHGPAGGKPILPEYPILAGQYSNYLEHALHEYKDGKRKNPVMGAQAASLSDEEIKSIALYFSLQRAEKPLYTPKIPEHKAKAE